MGFEFDENGKFYEWSPLFDSSSEETYKASLTLPTPSGLQITGVEAANLNIEKGKAIFGNLSREEKSLLKQNVLKIFQLSPDLKEIGTPEEYMYYILSRFPESKVKQILWHGSNADFTKGFDSATRGDGSGALETKNRNDFYFAKQEWSILQYIKDINVPEAAKAAGVKHWNYLWWDLKAILGNGIDEKKQYQWKDVVVSDDTVRENIPNKKGEFNLNWEEIAENSKEVKDIKKRIANKEARIKEIENQSPRTDEETKEWNRLTKSVEADKAKIEEIKEAAEWAVNPQNPNSKRHGRTLTEIKQQYGYGDKTNEEFFRDIFDIKYGEESFNQWVNRKALEFQTIANTKRVKGAYPAIVDIRNPYSITKKERTDTNYANNGVFDNARQNLSDGVIDNKANNEFHSDVVVVTNPDGSPVNDRIWWLGSISDKKAFKEFIGTDITQDLYEIIKYEDEGRKENNSSKKAIALKKKGDLIKKLEKNAVDGKIQVTYHDIDGQSAESILQSIQRHEDFEIPPDNYESCIKNSVVSGVQRVVSDPKNIVCAYSPITMKELQKLANNSPKGNLVLELTGLNPITKFIMQYQNMVGRDVIGVSAVGEKIFMGLTYYFNEGLRNGEIDTEHYQFIQTTSQIEGRSDRFGSGAKERTVTKITDTNLKALQGLGFDEFKRKFFQIDYLLTQYAQSKNKSVEDLTDEEKESIIKTHVENYSHADLMISQIISAATDNAKELILDKINGNADLINIYLHLIMQGYSINNIFYFMVSPAVSLMADLMKSNRFNEYGNTNISTDNAISLIESNVNINNYIAGELPTSYDEEPRKKEKISTAFWLFVKNTLIDEYHEEFGFKTSSKEISERLMQHDVDDIEKIMNDALQKVADNCFRTNKYGGRSQKDDVLIRGEQFINDYLYITERVQSAKAQYAEHNMLDNFYKDISSFQQVSNAAKETTSLGQFIQMCKEIPSTYAGIISQIHKFETFFENKLNDYKWIDSKGKEHTGIHNFNQDNDATVKGINYIQDLAKFIMLQKPFLSERYITAAIQNAIELGIIQQSETGYIYRMEFTKFINDENYRNAIINIYDLVKDQYNVYDVISKGPQYAPALKGYYIVQTLIGSCSIKSRLLESIREDLKKSDQFLDEEKIAKLSIYAEELLIRKFLREHEYYFPVAPGDWVYNDKLEKHISTIQEPKKIETGADIMTFKNWVEQKLIPEIEAGVVHINGVSVKIDNNDIIDILQTKIENGHVVIGLNTTAKQLENSTVAQQRYLKAANSLDSLDNNNKTDISIRDCLMLYSLIVYRNSPGNDRLSVLFNEQIRKKTGANASQKYLDNLGGLDYDYSVKTKEEVDRFLKEDLLYDEESAKFRMAPTFSYKTKVPFYVQDYFVREKDGSTTFYKDRNPYTGFGFLAGATPAQKHERMANYVKDGVLFLPAIDESNKMLLTLKSNDFNGIAKTIESLEFLKKLLIRIKC